MNYPDSVRFLYSLGNEIKTAKLGLERISRLAQEFGNAHRRPHRFVHVAGTNGKGSTCAMIESGLRASGLHTGLFTSPHLLEPTERIRIDGAPVSNEEFSAAFNQVHRVSEELLEHGEIDMHPTYFETVTLMAFLVFQQRGVSIAVLETGLGGRLDATNIVEPELTVITPIDFDHERFLGNTIESIAGEKAGILKNGVPVVVAAQRSDAVAVIQHRAEEIGAAVIEQWPAEKVIANRESNQIWAHDLALESSLPGRHQIGNTLVAATALDCLSVSREAIQNGLQSAQWPGRLQRLRRDPEIVLDGAHNPAGARALADYVREFYAEPKPTLIFGAMRDKAVEEMVDLLFPCFSDVIVTAPQQERALAPEAFLSLSNHPSMRTAPDFKAAWDLVNGLSRPVFVSGSLFLVSEAMHLLG